MRDLSPEPLTAEAFAQFGDVIEMSDRAVRRTINYGWTDRYDRLAMLDVSDEGGVGAISIFHARPLDPLVLRVFERHPLGSQSFMPLSGRRYLVAVAPDGPFDASRVRLFGAAPHQGVQYAKNVWHHFVLALDAESAFLVVDRVGPGDNLQEIWLSSSQAISVRLD
ncbi:MAG: ureidoglycolate lyase [Proteobacteria bacterium]|nr:ureidoglycolate lyase [Pseudomonadota bacterium]